MRALRGLSDRIAGGYSLTSSASVEQISIPSGFYNQFACEALHSCSLPLGSPTKLQIGKVLWSKCNLVCAPTLRGLSSPFDLRSRCPVWPKADPNHRSCRYPELTFIRPRAISGTDEAIEISVVVAPTTGQASVRIGWIPYANRQGSYGGIWVMTV